MSFSEGSGCNNRFKFLWFPCVLWLIILVQDQSSATSPTQSIRPELQLQVLDPGSSKPHPLPHMSKSKVAKLFDAYLVEVARDPNLSLARFQSLASALPEFSRASDDGLYRAVDTYLKACPSSALLYFYLCTIGPFGVYEWERNTNSKALISTLLSLVFTQNT